MDTNQKWALAALGCTGGLGLLALLGAGGLALLGLGMGLEAPGPTPYSDLMDVPQPGSPVEAPSVASDDDVGMALQVALRSRGLEEDLLVFIDRGEGKVYGFETHGSNAVAAWELLHEHREQTGFTPVILGDGAVVESYRYLDASAGTPSSIIEASEQVDTEDWLRRHPADIGEAPRGDYVVPAGGGPTAVTVTTDILHGTPLSHVAIALVPTTRPWEVPAWLVYGGWNDCPMPEVHVALMKRWHEQWGAEVISSSHDVVEMRVARPPSTQTEAMQVAREQFAYCYDIVYQGVGDIDALGASIEGSAMWYFWWD